MRHSDRSCRAVFGAEEMFNQPLSRNRFIKFGDRLFDIDIGKDLRLVQMGEPQHHHRGLHAGSVPASDADETLAALMLVNGLHGASVLYKHDYAAPGIRRWQRKCRNPHGR